MTLELPADSPVVDLPWIITIGPLDDDEDWEPVVCGPYERPHALGLARAVVADEDLMAVVEPLLPRVSVDEIRVELDQARRGAAERSVADEDDGQDDGQGDGQGGDDDDNDEGTGLRAGPAVDPGVGPPSLPGPEEILAGFARIAARLIEGGRSAGR